MASGKTSWSKEFVKGKSTWIRVNSDDLRLMCGDYWIPSREKLINTLEETTITGSIIKERVMEPERTLPRSPSVLEKIASPNRP